MSKGGDQPGDLFQLEEEVRGDAAQATDRQTEALRLECDKLHIEHVSAVADERPVYERVMRTLNPGDTFVVLDLDRAFRSTVDAMLTAPDLRRREGDDAAAIEASLAENIERLPMDEVDQYKAFAKLVKQGRNADDIASTFGITPRMVAQRLALGRLHPPILTAYRKGAIHAGDIRNLTMATPKQQKDWWALMKDEESFVPTGHRLKSWRFGGGHIPTENALFDVEGSGLAVVADLFGEASYFADTEAFWELQNTAIAEAVDALKADGWEDVILLDQGAYFANWEHRTCAKDEGGKVYVTTTNQGEVTFHKGYITNAEAARREKKDTAPPKKPN
jgi:ParB family chromosome partitioning protein